MPLLPEERQQTPRRQGAKRTAGRLVKKTKTAILFATYHVSSPCNMTFTSALLLWRCSRCTKTFPCMNDLDNHGNVFEVNTHGWRAMKISGQFYLRKFQRALLHQGPYTGLGFFDFEAGCPILRAGVLTSQKGGFFVQGTRLFHESFRHLIFGFRTP